MEEINTDEETGFSNAVVDESTQIEAEISLDASEELSGNMNEQINDKINDIEKIKNYELSNLDCGNDDQTVSEKLYFIKNMKDNTDIKYGLLIGLIKVNQIDIKEIVNIVLHLLVNGPFDMEQNFMIYSSQCVVHMLEVIQVVDFSLKAELLSVFIGILRKSKCNLMMTLDTNLIETSLDMLINSDRLVQQLLIELIGIVASFNVSVKELKLIFQRLQGRHNTWPHHSVELIGVLQQMPAKSGPEDFFNFPGTFGSAIAIPPISKWPYQNGWTFNCWIHLDPASATNTERDKPYLYCFRTSKGLGYSGHFLGNSLVLTTMKMKEKGLQHCIKFNFQPRRWYMITVVYVYSRWSKSEIRCYIDGQLTSQVEMSWHINVNENFDRCFIGSSPEQKCETLLTGQISCIYGFSESLNPHQIGAIYSLGPLYKGNFKFEAESPQHLSDTHRKSAFEGRLSQNLIFSYNPVACDRQLCLNQAPKSNTTVFAHSSHALMMGDIRPVLTQSIFSTLHSLGGIKTIYPLFKQLDYRYILPDKTISNSIVPNVGAKLINLMYELIVNSSSIRQQLVQSKGVLLMTHYISSSNLYEQLNFEFLHSVIKLCKTLNELHVEHVSKRQSSPGFADQLASIGTGPKFHYAAVGNTSKKDSNTNSGVSSDVKSTHHGSSHSLELIKHIYDYLLSNTSLWIYATPAVQIELYRFLAEEFFSDVIVFNKTRSINAVLQCLYAIKYYYWLLNPRDRSGIISKRPDEAPTLTTDDIKIIRQSILMFIKKLMLKCHNGILDEELEGFLNYLTVVNEDENIQQVLYFCVTLMSEKPSSMVPAFDRKHGIKVVFKLLSSPDETIRIMALKFLGFYLQRSTYKRKQDSMVPHNLFSLIGERLLLFTPYLTITIYNALYEILTEKMTLVIVTNPHPLPDKNHRLENPLLLKVIAQLIRQSKVSKELVQVHKMFLSDLSLLCNNSKENRRTVLQMSVWQDWLLMLAPLTPKSVDQQQMLESVLNIVKVLLHHAVNVEYGGWRVWIDTLAILHSKVSYNDFCQDMRKVYEHFEQEHAENFHDSNLRQSFDRNVSTSSSLPLSKTFESSNGDKDCLDTGVDLAESVAKTIIDEIVGSACNVIANNQSGKSRNNLSSQQSQENQTFSPGPRSIPFRIPEFIWSYLHQQLLHDLLLSLEDDLRVWGKVNNRGILEFVNSTENQIYIINLVHLVTMLSDSLITSCGGLLPLLAAATSPSGDVDMLENGQGLKMSRAFSFLTRVMNIADIVVFASNLNFAELEQEKTMSNGGILRQCLRLVCTCAVRNCLENRFREMHFQIFNEACMEDSQQNDEESKSNDNLPPDPLQELIRGLRPRSGDMKVDELQLQNYPISDPQVLLQEMDINRLRAVVYRDVEEAKQAQFLSLAIVYFLSVLMVSRYRDLLEPPMYDAYSLESSVTKDVTNRDKNLRVDQVIQGSMKDISEGLEDDLDEKMECEHIDNNSKVNRNSYDVSSESVNDNEEEIDELYAPEDEADGRRSRISGKISTESSAKAEDVVGLCESCATTEYMQTSDNIANKVPISSIQIDSARDNSNSRLQNYSSKLPVFPEHQFTQRQLPNNDTDDEDYSRSNFSSSGNLTKRLEQALGGAGPLVREIFFDFSTYLSRTLIGSHGQELVSSGLLTLKQSTSVVEMVMLLCSQEWQNSLQKHAGLAFIELVNEGRLLAHASRDHIVRVANEAHFILNRMRAEDVQKHSDFTRICAIMHQERQSEERLSEHLIASARVRDEELASRLQTRVERLIYSSQGVWGSGDVLESEFYKLDFWEDDSRRRRRFIPNPFGSAHAEAILSTASLDGQSPPLLDKMKTFNFKNTLMQFNLKSNIVAGVSINENTLITESGHGVTDEELFDAEKSESKNNDDSQLEPDLESDQDMSESSVKPTDLKETENEKVADETKNISTAKVKISNSTNSVSHVKQLNVEIRGPVVLSTSAILLAPGVNVHGFMSITKFEFYFEMDSDNRCNIGLDRKILCYMQHLHGKWHFSEIRAIFSRKFLHKNVALEIFVANRTAVMFAFADQETVKKVVYALPRVGIGVKYNVPQHRKSSLASPRQLFKLSNMTQRWQQREISNFDYLMYLNTIAGRTFNDLNQYPIYPWVLANYESDTIDLSSPSNYRDLSSPIGALNPSRKQFFDNRFKNWDDDSQPAFHYGTHYSTAAFVLNYLIRSEPYTSFFLNLQGGKFDHADRIFHSISQTWNNCQRDTSDVKELIPEFFYLPEMFENNNRYRFGKSEDNNIVDNVILPKWATSPEEFVRIHRQALESEFVSCQLHNWIDLIFGYKQRGPEAVRATNVFCYLTYEGSVNWDEIADPMLKQALEDQIRSFGQTPSQLLTEPHPPRNSALHVSPLMFTPVQSDLLMILKFVSNSPIVWMAANVHLHSPLSAVLTVSGNYVYGINKWNHAAADICRRPVSAQASVPPSITGTLPLATSPNSQGLSNALTSNQRLANVESHYEKATFVPAGTQLPLSMDPFLAQTTLLTKHNLGEGFDLRIRPHNHQFACTVDNRFIFACGFWDKSFRIFSVETGRLIQVIYGHFGLVTCIARSECGFNQDCYVVTGSTDCTVMLWLWGYRQQTLLGDFNCRDIAQPRMTITGHQSELVCVQISGELGIIISASKESRCLIHSLQGELLHTLSVFSNDIDMYRLSISREGYIVLTARQNFIFLYTINGKPIGYINNSDEQTTLQPFPSIIPKTNCLINAMVLSRDGDYIIIASDDGFVRVRRTHNLEIVHHFPRCDASIVSIALTTDQRFILAGLCNGCVVVFNIDFYKWHHEFRDRYPAL